MQYANILCKQERDHRIISWSLSWGISNITRKLFLHQLSTIFFTFFYFFFLLLDFYFENSNYLCLIPFFRARLSHATLGISSTPWPATISLIRQHTRVVNVNQGPTKTCIHGENSSSVIKDHVMREGDMINFNMKAPTPKVSNPYTADPVDVALESTVFTRFVSLLLLVWYRCKTISLQSSNKCITSVQVHVQSPLAISGANNWKSLLVIPDMAKRTCLILAMWD